MAAELASQPVNGTHGGQSGYESQQNGHNSTAQSYNAPATTQNTSASTSDIPKDEVGWYFVEQYYTSLSRSPDKLHLFYNKRSQFVLGDEADKVNVSVGQRAIGDRIKELDFTDCKVRVTNVDSQASDSNIVIQVIGEISHKSQPHRKFVQTFVLAGQTNGYFVLNDIFRYLVDEEEEAPVEEETLPAQKVEEQEAVSEAPVEQVKTLPSSNDTAVVEEAAKVVDKGLEAKADTPKPAEITSNGVKESQTEDAAPASTAAPAAQESGSLAPALDTEKPKAPSPTPALSPVKKAAEPASTSAPSAPSAAPSQPTAPAKPSAPKTWANLAAAAASKAPIPAVPATQPSQATAAPAQKSSATTPAPAAAQPAPSAPAAAPTAQEPVVEEASQDEWTSVGDNRRQQTRAQPNSATQEGPQSRGYIKNVHESVDSKELRTLMEKFGELIYFDIARHKNCAFVDFKTPEGYQAAVAANPHQLGNDRIVVEERRLKPGAYPYVPRGGMRGGRGGSNGQPPNRGSFQGGRGGGAPGRGRGGAAPRGRGGAQAA